MNNVIQQTDRRTDGRTDRRTDGQTDRIGYCLKLHSQLTKHNYIQTVIIYNVNLNHDKKKYFRGRKRKKEKEVTIIQTFK